ncbi:MAG: hypothetical protein JJE41_09830 [Candidatus Heimdallarchaeota archaeon]|nr:hypothetical protein [Candidatus Heimdallarchaeota archaeon]
MFEEEINKIKEIILHGESRKALEHIKIIEKRALSNTEKDILNLYKSNALRHFGHHDEALKLVEKVMPKFLENDLPKYYLLALANKARLLCERNQSKEAIKLLKQKEKILDSLSAKKLNELYEERCYLLLAEGGAYFHLGKFKRYAKPSKRMPGTC